MKFNKQFVNSLEDSIRKRGAADKLISNSTKAETSKRANDILRALFIHDFQSEACMRYQNACKRLYQTIKWHSDTLMDLAGAPSFPCLLAINIICFILNHTHNAAIKNIPINAATGSTCDIFPLHRFQFWQPAYFKANNSVFSDDTNELRC